MRAKVCAAIQMATSGNQTLGYDSDNAKNLWATMIGLESKFEQRIEEVL